MLTVDQSADVASFAFLRQAWTEEDDGHPVEDPDFEAVFASWWTAERDRRRTWLARADDHPVGMLNLIVVDRMPRPGRPHAQWGYLSNLYVLPTVRNAGVGRALLSTCVEWARSEGLARIVLHPSERARPLYSRFGFTTTRDLTVLPLD